MRDALIGSAICKSSNCPLVAITVGKPGKNQAPSFDGEKVRCANLKNFAGWGVSLSDRALPSICQALGSIPNTAKTKIIKLK
jgi:hypothetical protein